jgi:hypothetical protein
MRVVRFYRTLRKLGMTRREAAAWALANLCARSC